MNLSTTIVEKRILKLLQKLEQHEIDVYLVPSMDEHLNEFVPEYKQRLKAITGFTGSAGTALFCRVGKHQLFVDSRYHLQAGQEVSEKWFDVRKSGLEGVPTVEQWLARTGKAAAVVESGFRSIYHDSENPPLVSEKSAVSGFSIDPCLPEPGRPGLGRSSASSLPTHLSSRLLLDG